jgi:hypothetical protein
MREEKARTMGRYHELSKEQQEQFDKILAENQAIQKRNPSGSEAHRKAYETIRAAVRKFLNIEIGDY